MSETRVPCRPSSPDARASGPRGGDLPGAAYRSWAFAPTWATARITAWGASLVRERAVVEERVVGRPVEAPAAAPPVAEVSELPQIQLRRGVSPQEMHDSMRRALRMRTVSHRILAFYLLEMHRSRAYQALGIDAFILSGYPLDDEAERRRARDQFLRLRGTALETEAGQAMEFGVGRQRGPHEEYRPCDAW